MAGEKLCISWRVLSTLVANIVWNHTEGEFIKCFITSSKYFRNISNSCNKRSYLYVYFVKSFPCSSVVLRYEPRYGDFSVSLPLLWYKIAYFLCAYLVKSFAMFSISRPQSPSVSSSPGSSRSPILESEKTLGTRLSPVTRLCTSKTAQPPRRGSTGGPSVINESLFGK